MHFEPNSAGSSDSDSTAKIDMMVVFGSYAWMHEDAFLSCFGASVEVKLSGKDSVGDSFRCIEMLCTSFLSARHTTMEAPKCKLSSSTSITSGLFSSFLCRMHGAYE